MGCIKNKKKFLIFEFNGPHKVVPFYVKKVSTPWYLVSNHCERCDINFEDYITSEEALVEMGVDLNKLREMTGRIMSFGAYMKDLK